jgi:HEPN domain-containing protein
MGLGQKRADLRARAQAKLDDAIILLQNRRFSNAYYLAGYAIELGLKACVAAQITAETIPDKEFLKGILNHQFPKLIGLAGLAQALKDEQDRDQVFAANWAIASEWEPDSRYEDKDAMSTQLFIKAINDPTTGVLRWIKTHW